MLHASLHDKLIMFHCMHVASQLTQHMCLDGFSPRCCFSCITKRVVMMIITLRVDVLRLLAYAYTSIILQAHWGVDLEGPLIKML